MSKRRKQGKQQRLCRCCRRRPVWHDKNSPRDTCKRCYHRHVWRDRPSAENTAGNAMYLDVDAQVEQFSQYYGVSQTDAFYWLFIREDD